MKETTNIFGSFVYNQINKFRLQPESYKSDKQHDGMAQFNKIEHLTTL